MVGCRRGLWSTTTIAFLGLRRRRTARDPPEKLGIPACGAPIHVLLGAFNGSCRRDRSRPG